MSDRVRAAVLVAPGRYEVQEFPRPALADGAALVRMEMSGICGTDKHTFAGETTLVTTDTNDASDQDQISANGRYVAFLSYENLTSDDTGEDGDVFVWDRETGATTRASVGVVALALLAAGCSGGPSPSPPPDTDAARQAATLLAGALAKKDLTPVTFAGAGGPETDTLFQPLVRGMGTVDPQVAVTDVSVGP